MQYIFLEPIGEGSSAVVYKAKDRTSGEYVAIKAFRDREHLPGVELSNAQRIKSLYVCSGHHYCEDDIGRHCLVMEYLEGTTLAEVLKKKLKLTPADAIRIATDIAQGLKDIRQAGFVFRDLSPDNVLVPREAGKCKLIDLEHACPIGTRTDLKTNGTIGTPPYAAPEQASDGCAIDTRADVYAFGVLLCEMLSGTRFNADDVNASIPAGFPDNLDIAIRRCVDRDPARRFASVEEVLNVITPAQPAVLLPHWYRKAALAATIVLMVSLFVAARYLRVEVAKNVMVQAGEVKENSRSIVPSSDAMKPIRRVAILDFTNLTGDKSFDRYTLAIPELINSELANLRDVSLIDPSGVYESSPREIGKALAADAIVTGSFQKENGKLILIAHAERVSTGEQLGTARAVGGSQGDLFTLQAGVAKQLAGVIQTTISPIESKELQAVTSTSHSAEALHAFADGIYFLKQNLPADALKSFEKTLAIEPVFPEAQYYRAAALEKLHRTDDAIQALKAALPGADKDHPLLWRWPFQGKGRDGFISALDTAQKHFVSSHFQNQTSSDFRKQVVYAEALENATALTFVDLAQHRTRRVELDDTHILFNTLDDQAYSDGKSVILTSYKMTAGVGQTKLYAFSTDGSRRWTWDMPAAAATDYPLAAIVGDFFFVAMPRLHRVDVLNMRDGTTRWSEADMPVDSPELPLMARTKKYGDLAIFQSGSTFRAVRLGARANEKKDLWVVPDIRSRQVSQMVTDRFLIIFEPERRVLIVDLETGRTVRDIGMTQFTDNASVRLFVKVPVVGAYVKDNILYLLSQDLQLCAIDLGQAGGAHKVGEMLWKAPLNARFQSIAKKGKEVFVTTESELVVIDSQGRIARRSSTPPGAMIESVNDSSVVLSTWSKESAIMALSRDGQQLWNHPQVAWEITNAKRMLLAHASQSQIDAIDPGSGDIQWKHTGIGLQFVQVLGDHIFILGGDGVSEYSTDKPKPNVNDRQIFTALARLHLEKHDLEQASSFAQRAAELDPGYPPLVLVRARIYAAEKNNEQAGMELARYAGLVGVDSIEGQQAVAEMTREYRLSWQSSVNAEVPQGLALVGDRVVSVGRRVLETLHVLALNAQTGVTAWSYPVERFVATAVASDNNKPVLWHVSGDAKDYAAITLNRIDIGTGDQKPILTWRKTARIEQAWIAAASGRILVATASANAAARTVNVSIDAIDVGTHKVSWSKSITLDNVTSEEVMNPVTAFAAQADVLSYTVGTQRATLSVASGRPTTATAVVETQPSYKIVNETTAAVIDSKTGGVLAKHAILWRPSAFRIEAGTLYAFTFDGRAYAMKP